MGQIGLKGMKGIQGTSGTKGVKGKQGPPGKAGLPIKSSTYSQVEHRSVEIFESSNKNHSKARLESTHVTKKQGQQKEPSPVKVYLEDEADEEAVHLPQGTKDDPGTSCYELSLIHPNFNDGYFYMDPNQGCPYDAFRVFCNFTAGGSTCIKPQKSQINFKWDLTKNQTRPSSIQWFSQQYGGDKFDYLGVDVVQMRFLRLHSLTCSQRIKLKWTSNPCGLDGMKDLVHLLGDSLQDINWRHTNVSTRELEVELVVKVWGSSELHRGDMQLLPIRDLGIATASHCAHVAELKAELGPICFL
ncbi:collagen alpha-3(V) chain [Stigmatopora nigra]